MANMHPLLISARPVATISDRMCICIDLGQIAEPTRFWNPLGAAGSTLEVTGRPTYDFSRRRLRAAAAALSPGYLRVGGTEADRVFLALNATGIEDISAPPVPFKSVLRADHVTAIGEFARDTGLEVIFALNAGWGARNAHGAWRSDAARSMLQYVGEHALPFTIFELGNEPNAYPYLQSNLVVPPEQFAADFFALSRARDELLPTALLAAPGTAWFPSIGEVPMALVSSRGPPRLESNYQRRVVVASERRALPDILTWHYYPGQSDRAVSLHNWRWAAFAAICTGAALVLAAKTTAPAAPRPSSRSFSSRRCGARVVLGVALVGVLGFLALVATAHYVVTPVTRDSLRTPEVLDLARHWGRRVSENAALVQAPASRPEVWLGETGSAQAGGQAGVSGRWVGALWWLDQLALLSTIGHKVQCRQTLSGSDYGLLDEASLEPTPEFWVSVLWRRLMGTDVYAASAEGAPPTLRVYCHSASLSPTQVQSSPVQSSHGGGVRALRTHAQAAGGRAQAAGRGCLLINLGDAPLTVSWAGLVAEGTREGRGGVGVAEGRGGGSRLGKRTPSSPVSARGVQVWSLEAASLDAPQLMINGAIPRTLDANGTIPELPGVEASPDQQLTIGPTAAAFVRIGMDSI